MATYKTIKSYLVNLGFKVDKVSMDNMLKSIGVSDSKAIALTKTLSKAGTAVMALGTALVGTSSAALKFVNSVARSDLETERFARQMYTSYDSAKSFLAVLEQMGLSMNDIAYMTPEEYRRFNELRSFYNSVEMPDDYRETLASWRNAYTEVNKFQLLLGKFKSNIGYAILKTSGKTIDEWRAKFAKFNEYLQANMDKIAQKVAKVVDVFLRLTNALFTLGEGIVSLFDNALGKTTLLAGGVAGLIALFSTNPLMAFLGVLMLILLLIDDFKTWQRGGDSLMGDWLGDYEDFDLEEWIMTPLRKAGEWVSGKLDDLGEWLSGIGQRIDEALSGNPIYEFLKDIVGTVIVAAQALGSVIESSEWFKVLKKVLTNSMSEEEMRAHNEDMADNFHQLAEDTWWMTEAGADVLSFAYSHLAPNFIKEGMIDIYNHTKINNAAGDHATVRELLAGVDLPKTREELSAFLQMLNSPSAINPYTAEERALLAQAAAYNYAATNNISIDINGSTLTPDQLSAAVQEGVISGIAPPSILLYSGGAQ